MQGRRCPRRRFHQNVNPAERLDGLIDQSPALLRAANVGLHAQRAPASSLDQFAGRAPSPTSAPASASDRAAATPSPEEAPVTTATLPWSPNWSSTVIDHGFTQDGSLPLNCMNPASPGMPFLGLPVLSGAESSAVVRVSVSGAVSFGRHSAGSDNRRCQ